MRVINHASPLCKDVVELRNKILRCPLGMSLYDEDLTDEKHQFIVIAMIKQVVAACILIKPLHEHQVQFRQMAVDSDFQRKGIGSMLIRYAENFCLLNKYEQIELHARKTAVTFYKNNGYEVAGEEFIEVGIPHFMMIKKIEKIENIQ